MDAMENLLTRRSIRKYKPQQITDAELEAIMRKMADAQISVMCLPMTDQHLGGRNDAYNVRRAVTPVRKLRDAGVNVCFATNNIRNAFTPYGTGDLFQVAMLGIPVCHLGGADDLPTVLPMMTENPARAIGLEGYGIAEGNKADVVLLDTTSVQTAVIDLPERLYVIKNGKVNGSYAPLQAEEYIDYPRLRDKLDLAERAMKRSDFRLAHDYIDEAKRIAPEDRRVFFLNGKIYDAENRYKEALEEYRNAMLLAPYWAENYYRYGQALVNLGEQQDALFVLERMQYLFPNDKWTGKMEAGYTFVFH